MISHFLYVSFPLYALMLLETNKKHQMMYFSELMLQQLATTTQELSKKAKQ